MAGVKTLQWIGLSIVGATCVAAPAVAADLGFPQPPVVYQPAPPPDFGGWYLRGDIGITNQKVKNLDNALYATADSVTSVQKGFDSAGLFGVGVGYEFNSWLRADVTGEYRSRANFHGLDIYRVGATRGTDEYTGSKSEWLFLANGYIDLGTWWCITPFVGAGIGFSRNTIHDFRDVNTTTAGVAFGDDVSKWNMAWAVHAGLAYKVNPNFTVELAYRYVDLGNAESGDLKTYLGANATYNPMLFNDLTSHDIKLGVRWKLDPEPAMPLAMPPLRSKG